MALVSGRPISFQMDLYKPLYVPSPRVEPELFASLRPLTYEGSMEEDGRRMAMTRERAAKEGESNGLAFKWTGYRPPPPRRHAGACRKIRW